MFTYTFYTFYTLFYRLRRDAKRRRVGVDVGVCVCVRFSCRNSGDINRNNHNNHNKALRKDDGSSLAAHISGTSKQQKRDTLKI